MVRAIDCWVNVTMGEQKPPESLVRVKEDYFKGGDEFFRNLEPDALLEEMDRTGVAKAVITIDASHPSEHALRFAEKHPERFFYAASLQPSGRMKEVWALEALVKSQPVVMARVVPFGTDTPPSHVSHYPLYVKCIELDLPVSINSGLPGPPLLHGARGRPVVGGRDPAEPVSHDLGLRAEVPPAGADPLHEHAREAERLDLREGVLDKYLYANAERLFFAPRQPRAASGA